MTDSSPTGGCSEYRELCRRDLLKAVVPAVAVASAPAWLPKVAVAQERTAPKDVMIHLLLDGGMDGLTLCVPYGDPELYAARPTLAIAPPGSSDGAVDLDGFFGLAPAAAPLMTPFQNGHLAIVHATGASRSRSHFDALDAMETGNPENLPNVESGWLARHLQTTQPNEDGALRALVAGGIFPTTLNGAGSGTISVRDFSRIDAFPGDPETAFERRDLLRQLYVTTPDPLGTAALDTIDTLELLNSIDFDGYQPENGANYPDLSLGEKFKSIAALIKADVGLEAAFVRLKGWDLHADLGPTQGSMAILLDRLARSLEAFYLDLQSRIDNVVVVALSEFGRRVRENASSGTDHGHGNCMLVMGGGIAGGQVLTNWPGLDPGSLDAGDLATTIDYRDILSEILARRMANGRLNEVFPEYLPRFRGVTR